MICPVCDKVLAPRDATCPDCSALATVVAASVPALPAGPRGSWGMEALRVAALDGTAVRLFAEDTRSCRAAWLVALLAGPGLYWGMGLGATQLAGAVGVYAGALIPTIMMQHLACRALGGRASYPQFLRTMLATQAVYAVGYVPVVGTALLVPAVFWDLVVSTNATARVHGISAGRALATLIFTGLAMALLACL